MYQQLSVSFSIFTAEAAAKEEALENLTNKKETNKIYDICSDASSVLKQIRIFFKNSDNQAN